MSFYYAFSHPEVISTIAMFYSPYSPYLGLFFKLQDDLKRVLLLDFDLHNYTGVYLR